MDLVRRPIVEAPGVLRQPAHGLDGRLRGRLPDAAHADRPPVRRRRVCLAGRAADLRKGDLEARSVDNPVSRTPPFRYALAHNLVREGGTVLCTSCGTDNKPGRRFCVECGAALAAACPSCGVAVEPGEKFCGSCGSRLGSEPGAHVDAAGPTASGTAEPIAERRLVSILFADLVGFTSLAEGRDAEETRELLALYFELARDVVRRHGGTVEKFIGDAVMAVWGAPIAREDDAERAVRAALDLVDAVHALGPGIEARAGVLTGEAAVTLGATDQGIVAGDLVNTASRLQAAALPAPSWSARRRSERQAGPSPSKRAGDQELRGKALPGARLARPAGRRPGRRPRSGGPPRGTLRGPRRRAPAPQGPVPRDQPREAGAAGVGLRPGGDRQDAASPASSCTTWTAWPRTSGGTRGARPAYGEGISFWALGEMVRRRCGLVESRRRGDHSRTRGGRRSRSTFPIPKSGAGWRTRCWPCSAFESRADADELFGAWRTFFERLAASFPVVLVFEDFHFADSGLLDFVDHLLEWSRGIPIYVLTLARPELLERRPDWGAGKRNFVSLSLEPLPRAVDARAAAGPGPGPAGAAAKAVIARADGIPLYAVEMVRMLLAEGRLALVGRRLPADRRPGPAGGARDADRPDRQPPRRAASLSERTLLQTAVGAGPELRARRPGSGAASWTSPR